MGLEKTVLGNMGKGKFWHHFGSYHVSGTDVRLPVQRR